MPQSQKSKKHLSQCKLYSRLVIINTSILFTLSFTNLEFSDLPFKHTVRMATAALSQTGLDYNDAVEDGPSYVNLQLSPFLS